MKKIFLDSSVVIAGAFSATGASRAVLALAEVGMFQVVISRQVIDECERNLRVRLPKGLATFAQLLTYTNLSVVEDPLPDETDLWIPHIEAKDAPILAAAINAKVDRLLSLNTKDFTSQVALVSGLTIQTPSEFIREIRSIITTGLV